MEKLNEKKIFNVIFLLTFLGIVLSFSLFFYMSETMYSEEEENGEFFGLTYGVSDDDLFEYDSRFMKNSVVHDAIIETEYKIQHTKQEAQYSPAEESRKREQRKKRGKKYE